MLVLTASIVLCSILTAWTATIRRAVVSSAPLPANVTAKLRRVEHEVGSLEVPTSGRHQQAAQTTSRQTCKFFADFASAELSTSCCKNVKVVSQRRLQSYGMAAKCESGWECEVDGVTPSNQFETRSLSALCGEPGCLPAVVAAMRRTDLVGQGANQMEGICSTLASLGGLNANPEAVSNILAGGRTGKGATGGGGCSDADKKAGKCGSGSCFPAEAKVFVQGVGEMPVGKVQRGDKVLVDSNGQIRYEPIWGFLHRVFGNGADPFPYLTIVHEHGTFRASSAHIVFVAVGHSWTSKLVGNLRIGDMIYATIENSGIWKSMPSGIVNVQKSTTLSGMVAPFTASGTLIVDGVVASNYASSSEQKHLPHSLAHASFLPVRLYHTLGLASAWERFFGSEIVEGNDESFEEVHPYLRLLWKGLKLDIFLPTQQ